jgi:adenylyltransferase/sulfurtransferase
MFELGLGLYRWADCVIAGLDNREARLHVNRSCFKVGKPLIDGATEVLQGGVRVFIPDGPCYECSMTAGDWAAIKERMGCAGMRSAAMLAGRIPTTPITASIVGALQCQEALKLLHGLAGLGAGATLELMHEILLAFECPHCQARECVYKPLASVPEGQATCPHCGRQRRPLSTKAIYGTEAYIDRPFFDLGVPLFDIVTARRNETFIGFEFSGDARAVLGELGQPHEQ